MIYYFVSHYGNIVESELPKGWFEHEDQNIFTNRRKAIKETRCRIKERIAELKQDLKDLK